MRSSRVVRQSRGSGLVPAETRPEQSDMVLPNPSTK